MASSLLRTTGTLFVTSGMQLALSLGFEMPRLLGLSALSLPSIQPSGPSYLSKSSYISSPSGLTSSPQMIMASQLESRLACIIYIWHILVLVGALIAAPLTFCVPRKILIFISGLLILIGAILFTALPDTYSGVVAGRCLNGLGTGIAMVSFLVHGGESASTEYRGCLTGMEQYCISVGILLQIILTAVGSRESNFPVIRVNGIISIVFGLIATICGLFIAESPIYYLNKKNDAAALKSVNRLNKGSEVTGYNKVLLDEYKGYVEEGRSNTFEESFVQGLCPLMKMILLRSMVAFCSCLPLYDLLIASTILPIGGSTVYFILLPASAWFQILHGIFRSSGSTTQLFLIDFGGRKIVTVVSLVIVGGMTLGVGLIFNDPFNMRYTSMMYTAMVFYLIMQFLAGMFSVCTSAYLSEAFPFRVKPYLIAFSIVIEQIIHISLIASFVQVNGNASSETFSHFLIAAGVFMWIFSIIFAFILPETKKLTLEEASERFQKPIYMKCT